MKTVILALGLAMTSAIHLHTHTHRGGGAIKKEDLMQENPSHWRKAWPEGDTDNGDGDAEVLDWFNNPEKKEKKKTKITYPWTLDEDVIDTQESLATSEEITKHKLSNEGVRNGGMDMIDVYDNNKRVFERNTPYGNHWFGKA